MATENTVSKPLYDDEEEKRKRKVAEDYLKSRSAFIDSQRKDFTVDVPEDVAASMTDEQIKAEGAKRIGEIKTNFQNSFKAANEAGFKNAQEAEQYLNRGQARIVGDRLIGAAAGISASEWDKRDKSIASGNNPSVPSKEMNNVVAGGKVRMDDDTARVFNETNRTIARNSAAASPKTTPGQAAHNYLIKLTQTYKDDLLRGVERHKAFTSRLENERIVKDQAETERRRANTNYTSVKAARRAIMKDIREGKSVNPETIKEVDDLIRRAENARGGSGTLNVDEQRKSFISKVGKRINPYDPSTGPDVIVEESRPSPELPATSSVLNDSPGDQVEEDKEVKNKKSPRRRLVAGIPTLYDRIAAL